MRRENGQEKTEDERGNRGALGQAVKMLLKKTFHRKRLKKIKIPEVIHQRRMKAPNVQWPEGPIIENSNLTHIGDI